MNVVDSIQVLSVFLLFPIPIHKIKFNSTQTGPLIRKLESLNTYA